MLRLIGGTFAGVVAWVVIVTAINLGLRHGWPAYAAVEKAMMFTLVMKAARLVMSAVTSLASGAVARAIDPAGRAPLVSGVILLLFFLPIHYQLWDRFPIWYHFTFLVSLPLLGWLGGRLVPHGRTSSI
jgi:hypothetical protein